MTAELLLGKPVADAIKDSVRRRVAALASKGHTVTLTAVRVGDNPEDVAYEQSLEKAAAALGIAMQTQHFAQTATTDELCQAIDCVNKDDAIDGCILFRPLPAHIDEARVCNTLASAKDVDGISAVSLAGVFMAEGEGYAPATAEACMEILDYYGVALEGKHVVIVGRSLVIGKPVGMLLLDRNATVTYCHSRTSDIGAVMRQADIVVCAVGRPRFFDAHCFREGQTVLDVGINEDAEGLCGDVDIASVQPLVRAITPVPRGVGSVSTAVLLNHVTTAAERRSQCQ